MASLWDMKTALSCVAVTAAIQVLLRALRPSRQKYYDIHFESAGQPEAHMAVFKAMEGPVFTKNCQEYRDCTESYYSQHCATQRPACIFRPRNTKDVAKALKTLKPFFDADWNNGSTAESERVRFAIRGGGHAFERGFSSMDGGLVFDLSLLNTVEVSLDRSQTVIGAGNRWIDVSTKLDALGLAVAGGRNSDVGVGGLTFGGGISFLSPQMGMVCDNILEYEIVLADGTIARATQTENADLWQALKGGGNNFGIVTQFTAKTIPFSKVWGGYFYWPWSQTTKLLRTFHEFNKAENFDEHAAGPILAFGYKSSIGMKGGSGSIIYTKPEPWPAAWAPFGKLWRIWSTAGVRTLSSVTRELHDLAPHGNRYVHGVFARPEISLTNRDSQALYTTTIKNDLESILYFEGLFNKAVEKVKCVYRVQFPLTFQPLTPGVFRKGSPNVLGLESRDPSESFVIVLACPNWVREEDDETVFSAAKEMIEAGEAFSEARGAGERYRYLNYAARCQDPLPGYGAENVEFLQAVSRKYDPDGIFQRAVPGGFKLGLYS